MSYYSELTPNPLVRKFPISPTSELIGQTIVPGHNDLGCLQDMSLLGAKSLYFGTDFVAVTIGEEADWPSLEKPFATILMVADFRLVNPTSLESRIAIDSELIRRVDSVLEERIRPALAHDGGNAKVHSFEDGKLTLSLIGACSGCPSSAATLKLGIERMLKSVIPEIERVEQIA